MRRINPQCGGGFRAVAGKEEYVGHQSDSWQMGEGGVMAALRLDLMIERAATCICDVRCDLAALPSELASAWPDAPALELTVALASAAEGTQSMWQSAGQSGRRAQLVWQQAALVAAEVHYLAVLGEPHATAGDLLAHWDREKGAR